MDQPRSSRTFSEERSFNLARARKWTSPVTFPQYDHERSFLGGCVTFCLAATPSEIVELIEALAATLLACTLLQLAATLALNTRSPISDMTSSSSTARAIEKFQNHF